MAFRQHSDMRQQHDIEPAPARESAPAKTPAQRPGLFRAARFLRDDSAPSAIEYALLVAGVGVIIIAVVYMLGQNARSAFDRADPPVAPPTNTTSPKP